MLKHNQSLNKLSIIGGTLNVEKYFKAFMQAVSNSNVVHLTLEPNHYILSLNSQQLFDMIKQIIIKHCRHIRKLKMNMLHIDDYHGAKLVKVIK
jgi:hypothetical protein